VRAAIAHNFPLYGRSTAAPHLGKLPGVDQTSLPQELFLPQTGNPCKVSNTKESNDRHALDPSQIHPQHRNNRSTAAALRLAAGAGRLHAASRPICTLNQEQEEGPTTLIAKSSARTSPKENSASRYAFV